MTPTLSNSPKTQIEQYSLSRQATVCEHSENQTTSGSWKGKSWDRVRGIPNPFHYLWKYGPVAVGTGLLLLARGCSAQLSHQSRCVDPVRYNSQQQSSRLENSQRLYPDPEGARMLFLESARIHEAVLDDVTPAEVDIRRVTPTFSMTLEKPQLVNLKDMTLVEGVLYNNSPYTICGLYVEGQSIEYLDFAKAVDAYTAVQLGCEFQHHRLVDMTILGHNPYDVAPDLLSEHPGARAVSASERRWVESMLIYQGHWANSPGALCEIEEETAEIAWSREYPERSQAGPDHYSVYNHPVSGVTTRLLIDPTLTTGIFSQHPSLRLTKSAKDSSSILRINPEVLEQSCFQAGQVRRVAKLLVPSHNSQSMLNNGLQFSYVMRLDDLFAYPISRLFPECPGEHYTPANLVITTDRLGGTVYRFDLHSAEPVSDLRMRLLSYQVVSAKVVLTERKDIVFLTFDEIPEDDVHVSFYSRESKQMASLTLSEFTSVVEGKEAVSRLEVPDVLDDLLMRDLNITIKTDDDAWLPEFVLPDPSRIRRVIRFRSQAEKASYIHHGSAVTYLYKDSAVDCTSNDDTRNWRCYTVHPTG